MKLALAQLDTVIGDLDAAAAAIRRAADQAIAAGASLLITPELAAFGGYPPRDLLERPALVARQWQLVQELARTLPLPALIGCVEPLEPGAGNAHANALVACADGRIVGSYHKRLLPNYDVFDDARYYRAGSAPLIVTLAGLRIGLTVCEDIWNDALIGLRSVGSSLRYAVDPLRELVGACDLVVNVSASPYQAGKPALRHQLVATVAKRVGAPVAYCNQVGAHDELLFDGGSCVIGAGGQFFAAGPRWSAGVVIADLNAPIAPPVEPLPLADVHAALICGIRDYCAKTRQKQIVLGLSGGIDSALVAALAVDALGADQVIGLLMPGPYSSVGSVTDAQALAERLKIRTHTLPITAGFDTMLNELAPVFAGRAPDVAEENLQSRLRGVLVMAVANKLSAMALTTGNKSELAVGYCTIYGDMNGGLAPIGDLYKTEVWALSRHLNAVAGSERIPLASIDKPPSAELRPDQTDQDSLPPYPELDRILFGFLERQQSVDELIAAGEHAATVRRIVRLVEISEFKRRQSAPVLRVSGKAFGVGRRMPVARFIP